MISDTTLTNLSNGLGMSAMLLIVVYHFVAVNGKRMEAQGGKTVVDIVGQSYGSPDCGGCEALARQRADMPAHTEHMIYQSEGSDPVDMDRRR